MSSITKSFAGVVALDDVSFSVRRGTIHALLGENGAGKTTLMRIAFGLVAADRGEIAAGSSPRSISSPLQAIDAGLGMVHQHFMNVPAMTVAENVALGGRGRFDDEAVSRRIVEIGEKTGLRLDPRADAGALSVSGQQRLEIIKALFRNARILILDEPTAVLAPPEATELLEWLRRFADDGNAAVLITHRLDEALRVADDVTVLRRGRRVLSEDAAAVDRPRLLEAMLGTADADIAGSREAIGRAPGALVARLERVSVRDERGVDVLIDATLDVSGGEILGVAALDGNGQRELLRVLAGRLAATRGSATIPAVVGFVPADRHREALILDESLEMNVALSGAGARRGFMRWPEHRQRTKRVIAEYDVRDASPRTPARALSGGNQQKFVLGRELDAAPSMIVAENPTRGLDIRASAAVHARLRSAADRGAAVVVYSQDLDELLQLATRMVVVHRGRLKGAEMDRADIGRAMLGVA